MRGKAYRGSTLAFGEYGLQAARELARDGPADRGRAIAMTRHVKRGGKVWIRIFPDKPITKKPAETRMGKGKGNPEEWVAVVKPGRILYEMEGVPTWTSPAQALRLAAHKLPLATRFVQREEQVVRRVGDEGRRAAGPLRRGARGQGRELRGELFNVKIKHATGQLENTARLLPASPGHRSRGDDPAREARGQLSEESEECGERWSGPW